MNARSFSAFALTLALASGCDGSKPSGDGGGGTGGSAPGSGGAATAPRSADYLRELPTLDHYALLAAEGAEVKYLSTVESREAPAPFEGSACLFQNTRRYPYHVQFLRSFPEYAELSASRYEDLVLRRASRVFWGGSLKLFPTSPHPLTGRPGVVAYTIYAGTEPSEALSAEDIAEVDGKLEQCAGFARDILVFTPDGGAQEEQLIGLRERLRELGVTLVEARSLRPGFQAEAYSEGQGYGYLKVIPPGRGSGDVGPRDVVIADSAPNQLSLVAGLLTVRPQSVASHLNLRLREKGIPSASVPSILDNELVLALVDRLVRIQVSTRGVEIEPAALEQAQAFWEATRPDVGEPVSDLEPSDLRPLGALGASDSRVFGTKAANLGELHALLPPENRVEGFAIPFHFYAEFLREAGLDAEVDALLADPELLTSAAHKRERLAALRRSIRSAPLSDELRTALLNAVMEVYGEAGFTTRLRFRSSTNAEDLPGLSGAGLYDSASGCIADDLDDDASGPSACLSAEHEAYLSAELKRRTAELEEHPERAHLLAIIEDLREDLGEEKSAEGAVRRVWSSLWSERAFDDREYFALDHREVFMGIAVHPTFVGERLEAVVFTNLEPDAGASLYRVVSQVGEIGVVAPSDPTATPEVLTFRRTSDEPTDVTLVAPSSLSEGGAALWSPDALAELARALFVVQDHFAEHVYPELDPLSLDVEVDVTSDGRIVLKQARPYTPDPF